MNINLPFIVTATFAILFSYSVIAQKDTASHSHDSRLTIHDTTINGHPQTPHPPYPYDTVEVEYDNADKSVHLAGTFCSPKTGGPFTTILMITGSGLQDRDETILGHKPFAVIADYLTRNGFAVLKVDDRNKGKSKGEVKNATSLNFANDVYTSVQFLSTLSQVNKNRIGLMGHSEGGFIAPVVYTMYPQIAFIVSLAGPGVTGANILYHQQTDPVKGLVPDASLKAFEILTKGTLALIHDNNNISDTQVLTKMMDYFAGWKKDYPDSVLIPLHANTATPKQYGFQMMAELKPWFRYFIATDPADYWSRVHCPVLVLNGEKDIQVYATQNTEAIAAALDKAQNKKYQVKIFPGLNHLFQHCTKCTLPEYATLQETFSPEVLLYIKDWLKKQNF